MTFTTHKFGSIVGILAIAIMSFLMTTALAQADDKYAYMKPMSYDLDDYGVVPMADVIAHINDQLGGMIFKIQLDTKKNPLHWKYKSKVLMPDGRIIKIEHDPRTLNVIKFKYKS